MGVHGLVLPFEGRKWKQILFFIQLKNCYFLLGVIEMMGFSNGDHLG